MSSVKIFCVLSSEKGTDPFDILPEDWAMVTHNSGIPVYLNKVTRVCTLSRPYFIGSGSTRVRFLTVIKVQGSLRTVLWFLWQVQLSACSLKQLLVWLDKCLFFLLFVCFPFFPKKVSVQIQSGIHGIND